MSVPDEDYSRNVLCVICLLVRMFLCMWCTNKNVDAVQTCFSDHLYQTTSCIMWPYILFPFTVHFISIKPVLSNHLSYVTIFHCSLGRSHKTGLRTCVPVKKITRHFQIAFVTITFLMWEKPYISIFVQNCTHFGGHLRNGCQNDHHFEIAMVTTTFL
jgi:hypothetical protein